MREDLAARRDPARRHRAASGEGLDLHLTVVRGAVVVSGGLAEPIVYDAAKLGAICLR